MTKQPDCDAFTRLLNVRSVLITVIGDEECGRGTICNLEAAIAELMPVRIFDADGKSQTAGSVMLAECLPDDPDALAHCLDDLARGLRFRDGGGAMPIYEIERAKVPS